MKIQRVYIDTSVIGGCFDVEFATWSNALMQDFRAGKLRPVVSELVAAEVADAPRQVQERYAEILTLKVEILLVSEAALELAECYQRRGILPVQFYDDGVHIALATIAEVDLLVSWNFKHVVHYNKIRLFNAVNLEQGYKPLAIYSPREVASDEEDETSSGS